VFMLTAGSDLLCSDVLDVVSLTTFFVLAVVSTEWSPSSAYSGT
jgi:hypothetical protein